MSQPVSDQPESLKKSKVFDEAPAADIDPASVEQLTRQQLFDNADFSEAEVDHDAAELEAALIAEVNARDEAHQNGNMPGTLTAGGSRSFGLAAKTLGVSATAIVGWETVTTLQAAMLESPVLGGLYTVAIGSLAVVTGKAFFGEFNLLKRLKKRHTQRTDAARIMASEQKGEAEAWCRRFIKSLDHSLAEDGIKRWQEALPQAQTDKDVLTLFERCVLAELDKAAEKKIGRYATETALVVGISPLALVDMMTVLWRSLRMINEVSAIYGLQTGYWSRIKLIREVFRNIVFAGSTELITDFAASMFGMELAGKLSARVSQGLAAGILTGRLGFKVIDLYRPVVNPDVRKGRLARLTKHLLSDLKGAVKMLPGKSGS